MYNDQKKLPLKIFLSTGTVKDTEVHARKLKKTLESKGYDFEYIEVDKGHGGSDRWRDDLVVLLVADHLDLGERLLRLRARRLDGDVHVDVGLRRRWLLRRCGTASNWGTQGSVDPR